MARGTRTLDMDSEQVFFTLLCFRRRQGFGLGYLGVVLVVRKLL